MHARLVLFQIGPGMRATAEAMASEAYTMSKGMDGFVSSTYLIFDEAAGEYGAMTVWRSAADAEAAGEVLGSWMRDKIGDTMTGQPSIRIAEVFEPA